MIAGTGLVKTDSTENTVFKEIKVKGNQNQEKLNKSCRNIVLVQWKGNSLQQHQHKQPITQTDRCIPNKGDRIEIDYPISVSDYNKMIGRIYWLGQKIRSSIMNICNKRWWWPYFTLIFRYSSII